MNSAHHEIARKERESALQQIESVLEVPMNVLAFVWLSLTVIELTKGLSPFLVDLTTVIWVAFWIDYAIKLAIAPDKPRYLRRNMITLLALLLPALRLFRALRAFRFVRLVGGGRTVRLVAAFNRGMRALRRSLKERGFGYIVLLTLLVNVLGAAGVYAVEKDTSAYMSNFGTALWWTAMMLTTMGSDFFPKSPEGRLLALLLATYGFAIFGYVTATVASFFVDRDAASENSAVASEASIRELRAKLDDIQAELHRLTAPA